MINGRAAAPPLIVCSVGVSTSRKSLSISRLLILWITKSLFLRTSLFSGLITRSKYLFLYLSSLSVKASNLTTFPSSSVFSFTTGIGLMFFVKSSNSSTKIETSPVFVLKTYPLTPMISPISRSFTTSNLSSPTPSLLM